MNDRKLLVWQWGRRGAGPRYAYELAHGLRASRTDTIMLSLSRHCELYQGLPEKADIDLPISSFANSTKLEIIRKTAALPEILAELDLFVEKTSPHMAICAMPGFFDLFVTNRLVKAGVPVITIVHEAQSHPGDLFKPVYRLQKRQILKSAGIITLSDHVAKDLEQKRLLGDKPHATIAHIPFLFPDLDLPGPSQPQYPERKPLRLLLAGRLQTYKGLDLLQEALQLLLDDQYELRIAGGGRKTNLAKLAELKNVDLHEGWCSERQLVAHIDWADIVLAPLYRSFAIRHRLTGAGSGPPDHRHAGRRTARAGGARSDRAGDQKT